MTIINGIINDSLEIAEILNLTHNVDSVQSRTDGAASIVFKSNQTESENSQTVSEIKDRLTQKGHTKFTVCFINNEIHVIDGRKFEVALEKWINDPEVTSDSNQKSAIATLLKDVFYTNKEQLDLNDLDINRLPEEALKLMPNLKTLCCKNNPKLLSFNAHGLQSLTSLTFENLPALQKIYAPRNQSLTSLTLENLPALQEIDAHENQSLTSLSFQNLPALREILANYNRSLTSLTFENLPALQKIDAYENPSLTSLTLENLPALQAINAGMNQSLTSLTFENLPALQQIKASWNQSLTSLTFENLPTLQEIYAYENPSLTSLTLENLPALQMIYAIDNPSLTSLTLENLPALRKIDAHHNQSLTSLSLLNCPRVYRLNCSQCPQLLSLPEVPAATQLFSDVRLSGSNNSYAVPIIDLDRNPITALKTLDQHLQTGIYPSINFLDENNQLSLGIDIGGLRRHLQTTLLKNLFSEGENRVRFKQTDKGFILPQANPSRKDEIEHYEAIGRMLFFAYENKLVTGSIFPPEFFSAMTSIHSDLLKNVPEDRQSLSETIFFALYSDSYGFVQKYLEVNRKEAIPQETLEKLRSFTGQEEISPKNVKAALNDLISTPPYNEIILATLVITQALYNKLNAKWEAIRTAGPSALQQKIEGILSLDDLLKNIDWQPTGIQASDPRIGSTRTWLENYLRSHSDRESLERFLLAITGSRALIPNQKVIVKLVEPENVGRLPVAGTCFFTLHLPITYQDQGTFNEKLELFLREAPSGTGFSLS